MNDNSSREASMVVVVRDEHGEPTVWCDPEIVDLVSALNASGVRTVASCSGHGEKFGNIALADGRELLIAPNFDSAREAERKLAAPAGAQAPVAPFLYVCRFSEDYPWEVNAGVNVSVCDRCIPLYTHPPAASEDAARLDWLIANPGKLRRSTGEQPYYFFAWSPRQFAAARSAIDAARDAEGV